MFNFIQRRRLYFAISAMLIGLGIASMIYATLSTGSPFPVGVDFRGGTRFEVKFLEPVGEEQIRSVFNSFGINNPIAIPLRSEAPLPAETPLPGVVPSPGEGLENTWQVRTEFVAAEMADAIETALAEQVAPLDAGSTLVQSVSPAVGAEVRQAAVIAVIVAAIVILVYIMLAFRQVPNPFRYGACAVAAMLHDILVIFGFIAIAGLLYGWEVDALFLTAVLSVAGFSLQDTIVVFDRIRENLRRRPQEAYETIVNRSVLETIHRSLATQLSAMFILVAILLFGGSSIKQFIAVLLVGFLSGTYSSLFNAVPLLVAWERGEIPLLGRKPTANYK